MEAQYRLESVQSTLQLLDFFIESSRHELGVSEISRELGMAKSQVYRILQNLTEYGYIRKNLETRRYQLGLKFLLAGQVVSKQLDLSRDASAALDELGSKTREAVHLVLKTENGPVCIAERESPHHLRFFASVGAQLPWHAGSASKLLLAYSSPEFQNEVLLKSNLEAYTPNTLVDPDQLREELRRIRTNGYAVSYAEMSVGARAVAAPIRDRHGAVIASVSVVAPSERLNDDYLEQVIQYVRGAAESISLRLGYNGNVPAQY